MRIKKVFYALIASLFITGFFSEQGYSQIDDSDSIYNFSLDELMDIPIISVSKKEESNFESPLSSSVLTRKEITRSGVTTIAEALRLIPGIIVREQTNGIFDVHIRGFDYVPPYSSIFYTQNDITLIMIDNRVVYRDFQGGIAWEALPIELNDIERIEVIRGPSSSLYGPNAVAGVIHIITQRSTDEQFCNFNISQGNNRTGLYSMVSGFNSGKFSAGVSGNYHRRNRYETSYYDYVDQTYFSTPDSIHNYQIQDGSLAFGPNSPSPASNRYPEPDLALEKYGANAVLNYKANDEVELDVSLGMQKSTAQKIYVDVQHTPLSTDKSETYYGNFNARIYDLKLQASYLNGYANTLGVMGWEYNYDNLDFSGEYNFNFLEDKLSIRPGIIYRYVQIDDSIGVRNSLFKKGLVNGKHELTTLGLSLRTDFRATEKIRLIAALRNDMYNYPDKNYFSYQFASVFQLNDNHLLRAVISRANKGSTILDTYVDFSYTNPESEIGMYYSSNKNLNLMTMDMFEIGYRSKFMDILSLDIEIFHARAQNFTSSTVLDSAGINNQTSYYEMYFSSNNLSVKPQQTGVTFTLNFSPSYKLLCKPYLTIQQTKLFDVEKTDVYGKIQKVDEIHRYTPAVYGGAYINYIPVDKLNINANLYYYSWSEMRYIDNKTFDVQDKLLLNLHVGYSLTNNLYAFFSLRNVNLFTANNDKFSDNSNIQFAYSENINTLILFGLRVEI